MLSASPTRVLKLYKVSQGKGVNLTRASKEALSFCTSHTYQFYPFYHLILRYFCCTQSSGNQVFTLRYLSFLFCIQNSVAHF